MECQVCARVQKVSLDRVGLNGGNWESGEGYGPIVCEGNDVLLVKFHQISEI